jgi:hypothetical protein
MRRLLLLLAVSLAVIFPALLTGCNWLVVAKDAGPLTTKEYDYAGFDRVDVGSEFAVNITHADNFSVKVTSRENVFKHLTVSVTGKTLRLGVVGSYVSFGAINRSLEAEIAMPDLADLRISGASKAIVRGFDSTRSMATSVSGASSLDLVATIGDFSCKTSGSSKATATVKSASADLDQSGASSMTLSLETGSFVFRSSGSSDASGAVEASKTDIELSGASDVQFTGSGGDLKLDGSGSSGAKLMGFIVKNADIRLGGASDADVDILGKMDLTLSGSSNLTYGGNPTFGNRMEISGSSKVEAR